MEGAGPTERDILTYGRLVLNEGAILHQGPLLLSTGPVWGLLTSFAVILFAPVGSAKVRPDPLTQFILFPFQEQGKELSSPPSSTKPRRVLPLSGSGIHWTLCSTQTEFLATAPWEPPGPKYDTPYIKPTVLLPNVLRLQFTISQDSSPSQLDWANRLTALMR